MATFSSIRLGKILGRNTLDRPVLKPINTIDNNPLKQIVALKPQLITSNQFNTLKPILNIVDINPFEGLNIDSGRSFSPRLLNWVEPYLIRGFRKTLFFTEVNSGLKVGDRVFIIGGNYDSDLLIEEDKYKRGRDGYKVLFVDKCRLVLDIDFTGVTPYITGEIDEFIKIYNVTDESEFLSVNKQFTTRGGQFGYRFSFNQNNLIFSENDYSSTFYNSGFGSNGGLTSSPGFYVRDDQNITGNGTYSWINVSSQIISGTFTNFASLTYSINNRIKIIGKSFTYSGQEYKSGYVYKFTVGPTQSIWTPDIRYNQPFVTKGNFRDGNFKGIFNTGLFGTPNKKIRWDEPQAVFNGGSIMKTRWLGGTIESLWTLPESFAAEFDTNGLPVQKNTGVNNNLKGYNFIVDSEILTSTIKLAQVYNTQFGTQSNEFSAVENRILATSSNFSNTIEGGYFNDCLFFNTTISNSEIIKCVSNNNFLTEVKSVNSTFKNSAFYNSTYINDPLIKITGYDEFLISEKRTLTTTFSSIAAASHKVYKFYIDQTSYNRLKMSGDFYISGLKINDSNRELINFFDKKFKLSSFVSFEDFFYSSTDTNINNLPTIGNSTALISNDSFYKRGQEIVCYLSTPEENDWTFTSVYVTPVQDYYTKTISQNSKKGYSVDIIVNREDTFNNIISGLNFNFDETSTPETSLTSSNVFLGNKIDITGAYIIESSFDSGLFERSNWVSGRNINPNQDSNITEWSIFGQNYNLSISTASQTIIATTSNKTNYTEDIDLASGTGSVVFLNSVYYDTRGKIDGMFVSIPGSGYTSGGPISIPQVSTGSGLVVNFTANLYGQVQSLQTVFPGGGLGIVSNIVGVFGTFSGSGYATVTGVYTTSGGSGTGFEVFATIVGGSVTSVAINSPGIGYNAGDWITVDGSPTPAYILIFSVSTGDVNGVSVVDGGFGYSIGDTFSLPGGFGNAVIEVSSITGSFIKLPDSYKIESNSGGSLVMKEIATQSVLSGLFEGGRFLTLGENNRWGHIHKSKIWKSRVKTGLFIRTYFNETFLEDNNYNTTDIDFTNYDGIKNLLVSDSLFIENGNLLSKATYHRSHFIEGSDIFSNGIIFQSVWNSGTFSNGVVKSSSWESGVFESGKFYGSRGFNANPVTNSPTYDTNNRWSYWKSGLTTQTQSNDRWSWKTGDFKGGEFVKSDWEGGVFYNGEFYSSKWYNGTFSNGLIGRPTISSSDTKFYNGQIEFATVNGAEIFAIDTSFSGLSQSNILWKGGIFNEGVFGSDITQSPGHTATWEAGTFNGGEFKTNAVWKDGVFNGGKFTSAYNWQAASQGINLLSNLQSDYAWQDGEFNAGEFGNSDYGTNSTWYIGRFNGGKFKGRVWYNGIMTGGEFTGGATFSPVGGYSVDSMTESNASRFVDSFSSSFFGLWHNGVVSPLIDSFDQSLTVFDKGISIKSPFRPKKKTLLKDMLWLSGTFSHRNAQMLESVWLSGNFRNGEFVKSSFNPFVVRPGGTNSSFNTDDDLVSGTGSCIWEGGQLQESDFYLSQWKSGTFISGTAFGMIWRDGIANYMNAYNIIWENGTWKNGNWYGSYFQFDGVLDDPFNRQILFRGMNYAGTSSLHIWNVFTGNSTNASSVISVVAATPSVGSLAVPGVTVINPPFL